MIWQQKELPMAMRLRAYADLLQNDEAREFHHDAADYIETLTGEDEVNRPGPGQKVISDEEFEEMAFKRQLAGDD